MWIVATVYDICTIDLCKKIPNKIFTVSCDESNSLKHFFYKAGYFIQCENMTNIDKFYLM